MFQELEVPYFLSNGSLLFLVRYVIHLRVLPEFQYVSLMFYFFDMPEKKLVTL